MVYAGPERLLYAPFEPSKLCGGQLANQISRAKSAMFYCVNGQ